jgi:hypothetical protein
MGSGEWGVGSGEWGVGNGEWGMGSGEWEKKISFLISHSPLPTPQIQARRTLMFFAVKSLMDLSEVAMSVTRTCRS